MNLIPRREVTDKIYSVRSGGLHRKSPTLGGCANERIMRKLKLVGESLSIRGIILNIEKWGNNNPENENKNKKAAALKIFPKFLRIMCTNQGSKFYLGEHV
ncbi:hypothetical protein RF11_00872 [Thelohanellus kitauei]|uniref:Uncharacterized protein n=1 Tax=Thelohanellus kitauei TaxID=669202 RepID=A0A0C2IZ18_THEKT|nr:hypothetical protein RF11_00872 [Thelohanellus kitauei]